MKKIILLVLLLSSVYNYSQEINIEIPENTFSSSFLLEANSSDNMLLDISIFSLENMTLIKEIKLEISSKSNFYKLDFSELPKNSDFKIIIKEDEYELLNEPISNK